MSEPRPPRFCPNCGAQNPLSLPTCATCGQPLARRDEHARLWGTDQEPAEEDDGSIIDLYLMIDASSRTTTPFDATVPIEVAGRRPSGAGEVKQKPVDPWSAAGGRLGGPGVSPAPVTAVVTPVETPAEKPAPAPVLKRAGPPGLLLGCLGLLVIGAVALFFTWSAASPSIATRMSRELGDGIGEVFDGIDTARTRSSGELVITEEQINRALDRRGDAFSPYSDVHLAVAADGITATGSLYGAEATLTGDLALAGGRVVVRDADVSGPAGRLIDAETLTTALERELAALFRRLDLKPTAVDLRDGSLVIGTVPTS